MTQDGCSGCRHVREHVASLLPFKVIESIDGKPLRIGGIAMASGMSRNFNVYTPGELQFFADKLVNAPVYVEHVAVLQGLLPPAMVERSNKGMQRQCQVIRSAILKAKKKWRLMMTPKVTFMQRLKMPKKQVN